MVVKTKWKKTSQKATCGNTALNENFSAAIFECKENSPLEYFAEEKKSFLL